MAEENELAPVLAPVEHAIIMHRIIHDSTNSGQGMSTNNDDNDDGE